MLTYEERRNNLWKDAYKDDPAFEAGNTPVAKVINFFCKRKSNEPEVDITTTTEKVIDFDIITEVHWVKFHLDRTLKYKRKWYGEQDLYKFVALQDYINQCESGGYSKCLLSKQEWAMIVPKKK